MCIIRNMELSYKTQCVHSGLYGGKFSTALCKKSEKTLLLKV